MDAWLNVVVRQIILYSLPVIVSLGLIGWIETKCSRHPPANPFHAIAWQGTWLPWLAAILMHRGMIIALPRPVETGWRGAAIRMAGHGTLCLAGFALYALSLAYPPAAGLPPLHHWWAKVFMFFNLCMLAMHALPLPGMLLGELLADYVPALRARPPLANQYVVLIYVLLAASPLLDRLSGEAMVYPIYAWLSGLAAAWR